jgi:hypothetical protein
VDSAAEKTPAERAVGDEAHAELARRGEDLRSTWRCQSKYSVWRVVIGWTACARRSVSADTSLRPTPPILPAACSSRAVQRDDLSPAVAARLGFLLKLSQLRLRALHEPALAPLDLDGRQFATCR